MTSLSRTLIAGAAVIAASALVADPGPGGDPPAGHQHHAMITPPAFIPVASDPTLPRTGWTVTADSAETGYLATAAIDGNTATMWHTRWTPAPPAPLPHTFTIDTHATNTISGLRYLPRTDGGGNGTIGGYQLHTSTNGTAWTQVATGTLEDTNAEKAIAIAPVVARYVRLTATTEAGGRGPWTSAAELNLTGAPVSTLPRTGWTVTADSAQGAHPATNAIDGNLATMWHTRWTPAPPDPLPHTITIDMHATNTVTALRYRPRTDGSRNGTIGGYRLHTSTDGTAWTQRATGTLANNTNEKTINIAPTAVRYVRLTALTEAGNRGPWSSAAEINLMGSAPDTSAATNGTWGPTIGFPLVPAAAALMPGGRLLTWSAFEPYNFGGGSGKTVTATLDLATGAVSQRTVTETGHDMFCPGTARLPDGGVMVTGGNNSDRTSTYQPAANTWLTGPAMNIPRGYQSMVTLSDGRVFTIGGSWSGGRGGKHGEVWSAATGWQRLTGAPVDPLLTADPAGVYRADNHIWLFAAPGGRVFQAGPSRQMNWYDTVGAGGTTPAGVRADDADAMNGNAVMYDVGKILTVGGAPAYQDSDATNRAYVIDINGGTATARRVASMANARAFAGSVVLPDGKVVVVGGQNRPVPFNDATAVFAAELWDPATETFTPMASMAVPRTYHSVAALLPDGRVFSGGGGLCGGCGTNHPDGQIFTPPYLYAPDGSPAVRPVITSAPAATAAGAVITVGTDRAVSGFSLVRAGSTTHTVDTDQRRVPLVPSAVAGTSYTIPLPADPGVLVPGHYMLFALDATGVPSVSTQVMVS
ncbi:MAG TPA: discoidin domain-containing protein [Actinophytocola sp.]|uniref:discoidin domain-containing protein n=1 Tax=Actinophytocola sp. TaxID=1872138 RepID=UPI002DBA7AD6|nr:discoidin domain-containing protein [Actinophytocola sp.]HEU5473253.1 discoidin domain-containing protein [Actinophytocola sp.]